MEALFQFIEEELEGGQHAFADTCRRLIYQRAPEWLDLVDFEDDAVFLDPSLFALLTDPNRASDYPLAQILWGRTPADRRPHVLNVLSDANGVVWLSGAGSFATCQPHRIFQLYDGGRVELRDSHRRLECVLELPWILAPGNLHLLHERHPLLDRFLVDESGTRLKYDVAPIASAAKQPLEAALNALKRTVSRMHAGLMSAMNTVLVFKAAGINSFSNPAAHGAAFLNAADSPTEPFFIEDLVHQGGHVLFSALTFEVPAYLAVSERAMLSDFIGVPDRRTVYAALHGVFTEALMTLCLDARLRDGSDNHTHELGGRLGFILRRFGTDLSALRRPGLFSERGEKLFDSITQVFNDILQTRRTMAEAMDFSNQSYTFDYKRYIARNPI